MTKEKLPLSQEEIEKARDYLKEAKKNIKRLEEGKKVKRKIRFFVSENKPLALFILCIIVLTALIPVFIPNPPPGVNNTLQETVDTTFELITTNFTTPAGYPRQEKTGLHTSSELIILSTLANSLLKQTEYAEDQTGVHEKIDQINLIISNDTFKDYYNETRILPIFYQFLGVYAYIQGYYVNVGTDYPLSLWIAESYLEKMIGDYYSLERQMIIDPFSNTSYLLDQSIFLWTVSTYMLLTGNDNIAYFSLPEIVQDLLDSIDENFYNASYSFFYNEFDLISNASSITPNVQDLIFLSIGLSRKEKLRGYYFYFPLSSYVVHQKIIDDYIDNDWLVHEEYSTDNEINIKNQALFALISYLMNLQNVGLEVVAAVNEFFLKEDGYVEKPDENSVSGDSCFYGLISIASEKWSEIENEREEYEGPTIQTSHPFIITLFIIMVIPLILRIQKFRQRKNKK